MDGALSAGAVNYPINRRCGGAGGWNSRSEYEYNGLHWRTIARADMQAIPTGAMTREKAMHYDQGWRLLGWDISPSCPLNDGGSMGRSETCPTRSTAIDRVCQQVWGKRYIDDAVLRREDANADGDYIDPTDNEWNYITDAQFSVIALVEDTGTLVKRTDYTPYGEARHSFREDLDGDGAVDAADLTLFNASYGKSIGDAAYNADADFDRDGSMLCLADRFDDCIVATLGARAGVLPVFLDTTTGETPVPLIRQTESSCRPRRAQNPLGRRLLTPVRHLLCQSLRESQCARSHQTSGAGALSTRH